MGRGRIAPRLGMVLGAGIPLIFLSLFFAWPTLTLIGMGFITDGSLDLSHFSRVLSTPRTWSVIGQTLWMAIGGTVGSVILALPIAYVLYRRTFPGRTLARALVAVPFVLPTVAVSVGFRTLLDEGGPMGWLGLEGSMTAIILAMVFFNMSLVVRSVGSVWSTLDPRAEQAAAALGASPARVFRTVTLPSLMPAIASAASLVFLYCSTAYSLVLVLGKLGTATLETEIYIETSQYGNLQTASVLSILQLVVVVCALIVADRARKKAQATLRLDVKQNERPLSRRDIPLVVVSIVIVVGLVIAPMSAVVIRSFTRSGQWTLANYTDMVRADVSPVLQISVLESLWVSIKTALVAGAIALVIGLCVALVVSRRPRTPAGRRALSALDGLFMLPLGVSAVTVGFGFLVTLNRPPLDLSQSWFMVPAAQAVVAVPLVVRLVLPVLRAVDPRQREAAMMLGASPARVLATVDGPYLAKSALVAAGFAIAISLGEFGATSFLVRPATPTLPIVIYNLVGRIGAVEQGLAMSGAVLLSVATAAIMVFVERFHPKGVM